MNAPLEFYGNLILKRSQYPPGDIGDIWYEACLQLRITDKLLVTGSDKLQTDSMNFAEIMKDNLREINDKTKVNFDNAHNDGMALNLYIKPYFYNVVILQAFGILETALVGLCTSKFYQVQKIQKAIEVFKCNGFLLDLELVDTIDLYRLVRNRIAHNVGLCKNKKEAEVFKNKLEIVIETTQLRIMSQRHNCINLIETSDRLLHNVFRGNVFKEVNW